jgi:hypothetical protein
VLLCYDHILSLIIGKALCADKTGGDCDTYDVLVDESVPEKMDTLSLSREEVI